MSLYPQFLEINLIFIIMRFFSIYWRNLVISIHSLCIIAKEKEQPEWILYWKRYYMKLMTRTAFYLVPFSLLYYKSWHIVAFYYKEEMCMHIYRHYLIKVTPPAKSVFFFVCRYNNSHLNRKKERRSCEHLNDVFIRSLSFLAYAVNF